MIQPLGLARAAAWPLVIVVAAICGIADVATGTDLWLGPLYLLTIAAAAWWLGWREAVAVGLACLVLTTLANGYNVFPFGTAFAVWNLFTRWVVAFGVIALIEVVRRRFLFEWQLARADLLTGALNRQAFFELASVGRHPPGWSLIAYVDLDGFKTLNDEKGHSAGDNLLRYFAASIKKTIRADDLFARIGGDEFVICMNVRDEAAAKMVACRLHLSMNAALARTDGTVRSSLGVLIAPPGAKPLANYMQIADKLMYEAKSHGASLVAATLNLSEDRPGAIRRHELLPLPRRPQVSKIPERPRVAA